MQTPLAALAACAICVGAALGAAGPALASTSNDPLAPRQTHLTQVGAPTAWNTATGRGQTIAVVDSGVDLQHEDLIAKLVPGASFTGSPTAQDDCGHGTHVSGIAAASTNNGIGVAGIAPDAKIMPLKALSYDGTNCSGTGSAVGQAIRYAADNGASVVNLSLGSEIQFALGAGNKADIEYAWSKGVICVIAAGNQYVLGSGYTDVHAIIVTSVNADDTKSSFSSTNDSMWALSAPGNNILSTYWYTGQKDQYALDSGTSMSTPVVAGAAAVLRSMGLTPQETVDRLLSTAKDLGTPGKDTTFGSGRLDLAKAVGGGGGTGSPTTNATTTQARGATTTSGGTAPATQRTTPSGSQGSSGTSGTATRSSTNPGATQTQSGTSGGADPIALGGVPDGLTPDLAGTGPRRGASQSGVSEAASSSPKNVRISAGSSAPWGLLAVGTAMLGAAGGGLALAATRRRRSAP